MSIENTNVSGKTLFIISHRCERSPGMSGREAMSLPWSYQLRAYLLQLKAHQRVGKLKLVMVSMILLMRGV